ncbi:MAG TPA: ATP synthase F0 subunit B [Terriglobales bacterium]|nr:ATP synthase F0 subunit B [Terriglobales bacterium]
MDAFNLLAVAQSEGQVAQVARTFGVDWQHLGSQIISFSIVCSVLYKFAYQRILVMLEQRRQQIALGIANAEKIKVELDKTETQRLEVLAQAHAQGAKFIQEAQAAAARVQQEETKKAIAAAEQITAKAREAALQEHDQMLAGLKREVGKLVVQATTKVTGKVLTAEDQRRLAEEASKEVLVQ